MTNPEIESPYNRLTRKGYTKYRMVNGNPMWMMARSVDFTKEAREDIVEDLKRDVTQGIQLETFRLLPPRKSQPLRERLSWTAMNPEERNQMAVEARINSTDDLRLNLLNRYNRRGLSIYAQVRLVHRAHTRGIEHLVLYPGQASRLNDSLPQNVDRLAGKIRSSEDLDYNITLGGGLVMCVSKEKAAELTQKLCSVAEELFPKNSENHVINRENIYFYLSAFQTILALIHPFYEGNGRTSEDSMYILWKRRPDLADTMRSISLDGKRSGRDVDIRMDLINSIGLSRVFAIAREMGATLEELSSIHDYKSFQKVLNKKDVPEKEIEDIYHMHYDKIIERMIEGMKDPELIHLKSLGFDQLAEQLQEASPAYLTKQFADFISSFRRRKSEIYNLNLKPNKSWTIRGLDNSVISE